jgi:hypothetical protein
MHVFTRATPNTIESTMDPHKQILHTKHTTPTYPLPESKAKQSCAELLYDPQIYLWLLWYLTVQDC